MTIPSVTSMFLAVVLMLCGETADAFMNVASAPRCLSRPATAMSASAGLTRAEAIQRAAAGSGVLAAGVLLGGSVQRARAEDEMKDEVQQFAELRGQVEKKGRDEVVRMSGGLHGSSYLLSASCSLKDLPSCKQLISPQMCEGFFVCSVLLCWVKPAPYIALCVSAG